MNLEIVACHLNPCLLEVFKQASTGSWLFTMYLLKRPPRRQVLNTSAKIKKSSAYTQYPTVSQLNKCQKFMAFRGVILYRIQSFLSHNQIWILDNYSVVTLWIHSSLKWVYHNFLCPLSSWFILQNQFNTNTLKGRVDDI